MFKRFLFQTIIFSCCFFYSIDTIGQRTSIGFYYGPSIGYNSIDPASDNQGLFDFKYPSDESFFDAIMILNDGDLSYNQEMINGNFFGVRLNFRVTKGIAIQPEIQYQQLDFNHIVRQNGYEFLLGGQSTTGNDNYIIANYHWNINYLNFPFLLKLYPINNNLFLQLGFKFGFIMQAAETRVLGMLNTDNQYTQYQQVFSETVLYDFFDENELLDNHGFDKDEWPFNWNGTLLFGLGYETDFFYCSMRYSVGIFDFFREISDKDDDFFDNYNTDFDPSIYDEFIVSGPTINNNFKLRTFSITIGVHISSKQ